MVAYQSRPRLRNVRTARGATVRRKTHLSRARYSAIVRFCGALCAVLAAVMLYMMLLANLTTLNYALSRAERHRAALQAEDARMQDKLAALRSDDRLARLAAQLHMSDPQQFAAISLPSTPQRAPRLFLSSLASWFGAKP